MLIKHRPFYYIRHGQTDWNIERKAQGQTDVPLNVLGIAQAYEAIEMLKGHNIELICHSPLTRATQTANIINEYFKCPIMPIENLKEAYWGLYEGQTSGDWLKEWRANLLTENLESYIDFKQRIMLGINEALSHDKNVLIVAHGAVYWAIQDYLKIIGDFTPANCIPAYHEPIINKDSVSWAAKSLF